MKILFVKPIDQDPMQHSFMRGVLIDEFGNRNIPVVFLQWSQPGASGMTIQKFNHCMIYTVPFLYSQAKISRLFFCHFLNPAILFYWIVRLIRREIITHVIVRNEFSALLFMSMLRLFYRIPLYYQEAFPVEESEIFLIGEQTSMKAFLRRKYFEFLKQLKYYLLKKCDHVFAIGKQMHRDFLSMGLSEKKLSFMPMGVSERDLGNIMTSEESDQLNLEGRFIIAYLGALAPSRRPEMMIDAFETARKNNRSLFLLIIGGYRPDIERLAAIRPEISDDDKYYMTGHIERDHVWRYLKKAQVGLSIIPPEDIFIVGSPTKLIEMMACGLTVIANTEIEEQKELCEESHAIIPCAFNRDSISAAIERSYELKDCLSAMGSAGRAYVLEKRLYSRIAEHMIQVLRS